MKSKKYLYGLIGTLILFVFILGCSTKKTNNTLPEPDKTLADFLDLFIAKDWKGINNIVTKQTKIKFPSEELLRQGINQSDQIELLKVIKIIPVEHEGDIGFGVALINYKMEGKVGKDIMTVNMKKVNGKWLIALDPSEYTLEENQTRIKLEKQMENKFAEMKKNDLEVKMFWSEYQRQVNKF